MLYFKEKIKFLKIQKDLKNIKNLLNSKRENEKPKYKIKTK